MVTSSEQRRAWGLPDLGGGATVPVRTGENLRQARSRDAVPLVDVDDAIPLLVGNGAGRQAGVDDDIGGRREFEPPRRDHAAAEVVNLRHDRGPILGHVRRTFDELSGRARIDALLDRLDKVLGPLERETLPELEDTRREIEALRPLLQRELAPERLRAGAGADRTAGVEGWSGSRSHELGRCLVKVSEVLQQLDLSVPLDIEMTPFRIERFLERGREGRDRRRGNG